MGWTYGYSTRREIIDYAISPQRWGPSSSSALRWCCRGNVMYILREQKIACKPANRFIEVWLLENGGERHGWGYKNMDESMGPYYNNCPLSYFEDASLPVHYAKQWRENCRKYQGEPKRKAKPKHKNAAFSISDPRTANIIDEVTKDLALSQKVRESVDYKISKTLMNVHGAILADLLEKTEVKE